jgi:hypothetical protein
MASTGPTAEGECEGLTAESHTIIRVVDGIRRGDAEMAEGCQDVPIRQVGPTEEACTPLPPLV